jgi:hypothetical protein
MKKILFVLASFITITGLMIAPVFANNDDEDDWSKGYRAGKGGFRWQRTESNPDVPDAEDFDGNVAGEDGSNTFMETIRIAINWLLWLLAFIALLFLLYGGFKVLTAGTDEAALGEAWKIVKNAGLGILMIAISWIIVTFIFYIAGILTEDTDTQGNAIGSEELEGTKNAELEDE